jgi:hypothetical protein
MVANLQTFLLPGMLRPTDYFKKICLSAFYEAWKYIFQL